MSTESEKTAEAWLNTPKPSLLKTSTIKSLAALLDEREARLMVKVAEREARILELERENEPAQPSEDAPKETPSLAAGPEPQASRQPLPWSIPSRLRSIRWRVGCDCEAEARPVIKDPLAGYPHWSAEARPEEPKPAPPPPMLIEDHDFDSGTWGEPDWKYAAPERRACLKCRRDVTEHASYHRSTHVAEPREER